MNGNPITAVLKSVGIAALALLLMGGIIRAAHADQTSSRGVISLGGSWAFRMDRDDKGVQDRWYDSALPDRINLPGSMTGNGSGDEVTASTKWTGEIVDRSWFTEPRYQQYREGVPAKVPFWLTPVKYYVGPAWYQRQIVIPEAWQGKRIVLFLERPHWETRVWVDGRGIGIRNSLSVPHEYDLGAISPGAHRLTICVDNRVKVDVGINAHSVSDHTQTNWNGIVGRIELRVGDPVWIDDVQVYPDVRNRKAKIRIAVANATSGVAEGTLSLRATSRNSDRKHLAEPQQVKFTAAQSLTMVEVDYALGHDALLWSEFSPALYSLGVSLAAEGKEDKFTDQKDLGFGLREFKAHGTQFALNGNPVFIRGTLECCIFPLTGYPPTDVESWRRILRIARSHGLNSLRFHSWCPPEAAFQAGDEMGFLFQVEGGVWTKVGEDSATDSFIRAECDRILKAYGNHPSFCTFTHGNEPAGGKQARFLGDLVNSLKAKDPRHLYTSGAGWPQIPENDFHCTPEPRVFAWGAGLQCRLNARAPETMTDYRQTINKWKVPVVSHEIGQWCVYPNLDEIKKYTGVTRALNFEIFRDTLASSHMLDQARDFLMASGKLQVLCYKEDIEAALRTPGMAGFRLLDLHDFPGQGTALVGVLDPFWDSKGYVTPEEYHRFACETVPLARMQKRIWTSEEIFTARLEIAHFGAAAMTNAVPVWSLATADGRRIADGELPARTIPLGNGIELGQITVPLVSAPVPAKLVLTVGIKGTGYINDWDLWVYPAQPLAMPDDDVLIVNRLDEAALVQLAKGRKVLLLPAPGTVKGDRYGKVPAGFTSIFWNTAWTRRQAPHTLGILCNPKHPALAEFPTEYHSNWQWWELLSRSQTMILSEFPAAFRPLVQVIDDWHTNRRLGLVFEARVSGGKLLVCGIDLSSELESRHVARQLRSSLLKYMSSSSFDPRVELDAAVVQSVLTPPTTLQRLGARVIKADSEAPGYSASMAIDGDPMTLWHTPWQPNTPPYPHEIQIDLQKVVSVKGFRYVPRQDVHNGWAQEYALYVSEDGQRWGEPVAKGTFAKDPSDKQVLFGKPERARFMRFVGISGFDGQQYATLAELDVMLE